MHCAMLWETGATQLLAEPTDQWQPGPPNLPYLAVADLPGKDRVSAKPHKTQDAPRRGIPRSV